MFGCKCFPWLVPYAQNKLQPKSKPCVFLGYSLNHQGYKCLDLSTRRIYLSRHVLFNEDFFPFQELASSEGSVDHMGNTSTSLILFNFSETPNPFLSSGSVILPSSTNPTSPPLPHSTPDPVALNHQPPSPTQTLIPLSHVEQGSEITNEPINENVVPPISQASSHHLMVTRSRLGVQKPNPKYALNVVLDTKCIEPTCFSQAVKQEEWRHAMA